MRNKKFGLTGRQKEVFNMIKGYIDEHGKAPLDREIQDALEIKSPRNVTKFKEALRKRGWIDYQPRSKRSIIIL